MAQRAKLGPQDILGITGPAAVTLRSSSPLNVAILESRSVKPEPGLKVMPRAPTVAPTTTKPPCEEVTAGVTPEVAALDPLALAWEARGLLGSAPEYCKTLIVSHASDEGKLHLTTLLALPLMFLAYHIWITPTAGSMAGVSPTNWLPAVSVCALWLSRLLPLRH